MIVCDWTTAAPWLVRPLYTEAHERWLRTLGWDTSSAWATIELARTTWGLPGHLAVDDGGHIQGWMYWHQQDDVAHVGGVAAEMPVATRALVARLAALQSVPGLSRVSGFVFDEAPGLERELRRHGFTSERFLYLSRDLDEAAFARFVLSGHAWGETPDDRDDAAMLLWQSYEPHDARHFAPGGTLGAWQRYLTNLIEQTGLGRFRPDLTTVLRGHAGVDAAVLVTALSNDTAHLAQVVVHPNRRGEGVAGALVDTTCARAAAAGFRRATLLVHEGNTAARRVYERRGFVPRATFLAFESL